MNPIKYLHRIPNLVVAIRLRLRVEKLRSHLRGQGVHTNILTQYRKKETAHRWSTSYSILNGEILIKELAQLKNGCDKDGNLWYQPSWRKGISVDEAASRCPEIVKNAKQMGPRNSAYAEEGYRENDVRRKPNIKTVPVSKHVYGLAIDMNVDWSKLDGPWSEKAILLVKKFGLDRPKKDERWHFELASLNNPQKFQ